MVTELSPSKYFKSYFSAKNSIHQILVLLTAFCIVLVAFRVLYTGEGMFTFLIWNLFLAYLPYFVSANISKAGNQLSKPVLIVGLVIWLLLIPNSFYIITDLFHLRQREEIPLWYDLALIMSFAWNGLIVGVLSVRQIEKVLQSRWRIYGFLFVVPVMYLNALGIFIGRYLRFNSWDVITNLFNLIKEVGYLLIHPIRNRFDWCMIICFTILLSIFYLTLKKISRDIEN